MSSVTEPLFLAAFQAGDAVTVPPESLISVTSTVRLFSFAGLELSEAVSL